MLPDAKAQLRIPTAAAVQEPRQRGHLGRRAGPLPAAAGRGGRRLRPHRDRGDAAARRGRRASSASAPATRAAARTASRSATSSPAPTSWPRPTVLAEGCWGHLTGAAIREFDLGRGPRAAGLGARRQGGLEGPQAAGPPDPHDRPVAAEAVLEVRADRRHVDLPDEGREDRRRPRLDRLRHRPRVRRRDDLGPRPAAAVQDCTRSCAKILEGGERVGWGAKALPGGGYWSMPKLTMPGARARRRRRRAWSTRSRSRASTTASSRASSRRRRSTRALKRGETRLRRPTSRRSRSRRSARSSSEVRNTRQPFQKGFLQGGPLVNLAIATQGQAPPGRLAVAPQRRASRCSSARRKDRYPKPDGKYTFDKLSSVFITRQRDARRRAEPHPRAEARAARDRRDVGVDVPGRRLRDPRRRARGRATST